MTEDAIQIREFREGDLDAVIAFSLRAWAPIFDSIQEVLGDEIFLRLHPDWRADQAEAVRSSCLSEERDVFVALADGRPVGFAAVALNAFHERMGVIDIIGVDPDYQRRGISSRLTEHATEHMLRCGMDIAVVETGGDPGHAPARAAYEAAGFTLLPIARYFRMLESHSRTLAHASHPTVRCGTRGMIRPCTRHKFRPRWVRLCRLPQQLI